MVRAVGVIYDVLLADLTAPGVMAGYFGLNLEQLASRDYTHTQQVSAQVHAMLGDDGQVLFDGCSSVAQQLSRQEHRAVRACQREGQRHRGHRPR